MYIKKPWFSSRTALFEKFEKTIPSRTQKQDKIKYKIKYQ